jgi:hypothetical protein
MVGHAYPSSLVYKGAKLAFVAAFALQAVRVLTAYENLGLPKEFAMTAAKQALAPIALLVTAVCYGIGALAFVSSGGELCGSAILMLGSLLRVGVEIGSNANAISTVVSKALIAYVVKNGGAAKGFFTLGGAKAVTTALFSTSAIDSIAASLTIAGACAAIFFLCLSLRSKAASSRTSPAVAKKAAGKAE